MRSGTKEKGTVLTLLLLLLAILMLKKERHIFLQRLFKKIVLILQILYLKKQVKIRFQKKLSFKKINTRSLNTALIQINGILSLLVPFNGNCQFAILQQSNCYCVDFLRSFTLYPIGPREHFSIAAYYSQIFFRKMIIIYILKSYNYVSH